MRDLGANEADILPLNYSRLGMGALSPPRFRSHFT